LAVVLALSACGSGGNVVTEDRSVGEFESLDVSGALNVVFIVDPNADSAVSVEYDEDFQERIVSEVRDGVLALSLESGFNLTGGVGVINVTMNSLESLTVNGASEVTGSGEMESYKLVVSGASEVTLEDLIATDVDVDVDGASEVQVFVSGVISGRASGASEIGVFGDPASVEVDTSGLAEIVIR
jgi:hypothetical protein